LVELEKVSDVVWRISERARPGMRVPVYIYANRALLEKMQRDRTLHQAMNVASLPGIYKFAIVLPDGHERARA
jgi:tRNA-splicing ligase RtcB